MQCEFCSKEIPDNSTFCIHCGEQVALHPTFTMSGAQIEQKPLTPDQKGTSESDFFGTLFSNVGDYFGTMFLRIFGTILLLVCVGIAKNVTLGVVLFLVIAIGLPYLSRRGGI